MSDKLPAAPASAAPAHAGGDAGPSRRREPSPQTALLQRRSYAHGAEADGPETDSLRRGYGSVSQHVVYSKNNVLDLRAAQRTFDGAYTRTALGQLSYSVVILRLFQPEFYLVGIAYVVLAVGLILMSIMRYNLTMESPAESIEESPPPPPPPASSQQQQPHNHRHTNSYYSYGTATAHSLADWLRRGSVAASVHSHASQSHRQTPRVKETFRTAGGVVAFATAFTLALQIALLVLILKL